ncbi:MAG: Phenylacetic acid catabolic protein, partial [Planctomycetota bacterium]
LESAGLYPPADQDMFEQWSQALLAVTDAAGLELALKPPSPNTPGGRRGHHTKHLKPLLDEMCEVYRLEPEAAW